MPRFRKQVSFEDIFFLRRLKGEVRERRMTRESATLYAHSHFVQQVSGRIDDMPLSFKDLKAYFNGEPLTDYDAPETEREYVERLRQQLKKVDSEMETLEAERSSLLTKLRCR